MGKADWTDLEEQRVRNLAAQKLSANDIGEMIGRSRNSVIGYCHRKGILLQAKVGRRHGRRNTHLRRAVWTPTLKPRVKVMTTTAPVPLHLTIWELKEDSCRWPYGDSNYTFCGHPKMDDRYCGYHMRRSYAGGITTGANDRKVLPGASEAQRQSEGAKPQARAEVATG